MRTNEQNTETIREQLIKKGCDGDILDYCLTLYRGYCSPRKEEFEWIKGELDTLYHRLTKLAADIEYVQCDIEQVFAKPLNLFCEESLDTALKALSVARTIKPSLGPNPPVEFNPPQDLQTWPALVRSYAESLKEINDRIVGPMAVKKDSPAKAIMMVYAHCNESMLAFTYREIADLLNEATSDITDEPITEEAVRQHVKRKLASYFAKLRRRELDAK